MSDTGQSQLGQSQPTGQPQRSEHAQQTGHQVVDSVITDLQDVENLEISDQIDVLTSAVDTLAAVLATSRDLDQAPIPGVGRFSS